MSVDLKVKSGFRNILRIALPVSIAIFIPQLNILTNTLFLGNYHPAHTAAGTQDLLAASGLAGIYYLALVMTNHGLVSGILMLMSRKAGENDQEGLTRHFVNGIFLCLLMSGFLLGCSLYLAPFVFQATIHNTVIRDAAIQFIHIRVWGLPFMALCQLANSLFLSTSRSALIAFGSGTQTILNIVFDYLLIFGIGSFPEWGLQGSAVASVLSEFGFLLVSAGLVFFHPAYRTFPIRRCLHADTKLMQHQFVKSLPLMVQYFLSIAAWEVFFIYVEHLGKAESALSQMYRSVFGIVGVGAWALASTCNSMVSNLIGQQALSEVIPLIRRISGISFLFAFLLGMPLLLFPSSFLHLLTSDTYLVETGVSSLRIVVVATWMLSVSTIVFNGVAGTGSTRLNMWFELTAIILYLLYNTLMIERWNYPLPYAWLSEFIYWFTLFALSFWFFYTGRWKRSLVT